MVEVTPTMSSDTPAKKYPSIFRPALPVLLTHPDLQLISAAVTLTTLSVQYFLKKQNCLEKTYYRNKGKTGESYSAKW